MTEPPILTISDLSVEYPGRRFRARPVSVIEGVSFTISRAETVALVGESGSGKTTIGKAILGLAPASAGRIELEGQDITALRGRDRRALAGTLQAVFQNPYGSLNPSLTIGATLAEPFRAAGTPAAEVPGRIAELLQRVGLPEDAARRYPAQFSGGQRQRIAIARAVARRPRLIVCDEPTSALDVTTQATALALLKELQETLGCAYLFITHNLALVREFADRAIVLERGRVVESGTSRQVCDAPRHPYTRRLVAAAPVPDPVVQRERRELRLASVGPTAE
jgi:peptide/nickel transport system ATP-binding protein